MLKILNNVFEEDFSERESHITFINDKDNRDYCVIVDETATITSITVSNGTYIVSGDSNFMSLDVTSVTSGNMNSFVCE